MSADQQKEYDEADQIYNVLELASAYFTDQINKEVEGYLPSPRYQ